MTRFTPILAGSNLTEAMRLIGEIDEFKGHWRKLKELRAEKLARLRQVTTIESAASSTRIEGVELSDGEVAEILQGLSHDSFRARDEAEVRGYGELLQLIFESYESIDLTENHVKQLHEVLLRHSSRDEWHRGNYKSQANHVEARHPDGRTEVVFFTASPFETPRLIRELVEETSLALENRGAHPLIVIGHFIVDFLAIHPFQDGNGRLARAMTTLLLIREGYSYVPYSSLERVIEENKQAYYAALRESQTAMRVDQSDYSAWLLFFLRALHAQKRNLESKLEVERSMHEISELQERIIGLVDRHGRVTTTQLGKALEIPVRTVRYHLEILIGREFLQPHGQKRGRYYTRSRSASGAIASAVSPTAEILAAILDRGGRISKNDLIRLAEQYGYSSRAIGSLHGRRTPHLRRDSKTGDSLLTPRGQEVAEQYLFAKRLARAE